MLPVRPPLRPGGSQTHIAEIRAWEESLIRGNGFWEGFDPDARASLEAAMRPVRVARGETLIERGALAETLYIVEFGLFEVRDPNGASVAEIGAGELIGEIGFFAQTPRAATVVAARDSEVREIDRAGFEALARAVPGLQSEIIRALASRLWSVSAVARAHMRPMRAARVVAFVAAGAAPLSPVFVRQLRGVVAAETASAFLGEDEAARIGNDAYALARWLSEAERTNEFVACLADGDLANWTEAALRGADQVVLVAEGEPAPPGPAARRALEMFEPARRRLALVRPQRAGFCDPSDAWREGRPAQMIHNVALDGAADLRRLVRFLRGRAVGLVTGGGGAYGSAHLGVHQAFLDRGVEFDVYGGSSVGAAMAAAFAALADTRSIQAGLQEMMVRRRALKRVTWPRYGLLDHTVFDAELRQIYPGALEDLWKPCFTLVTDLTSYSARIVRAGPVWEAIRASAAIPGVLPPFFDENGHMLVDGGVVDNVPLAAMRALKSGPNVVVDLRSPYPDGRRIDYATIPGRRALIGRTLAPLPGRRALPDCPGPISVILRTLFANIGAEPRPEPGDMVLRLPDFPGSSLLDWERHREVFDDAYAWTQTRIDRGLAEGEPALTALLKA